VIVRATFLAFVLLALLGDVRIFLFVMNRFVWGTTREEKNPWGWLIWVVPPLLLVLTALFWPVNQWIDRLLAVPAIEKITPDRFEEIAWSLARAKLGAAWLIAAAAVGSYWLLERIRINYIGIPPLAGIRTLPSEIVRLRRAHVPFASLRKLGAHNDVYDIEVTRNEIVIDDLPEAFDGYRIAFLTDTHVASFLRRTFYRAVVDQVRAFDPDLILLGGDFVSFHRHIPLLRDRLLDGLTARDGVFAVLGNHDYWSGPQDVMDAMTACGVRFLTNAHVMLARGAATLPLCGIDEVYRGKPDPAAAFASIDAARPCLAISHHPDIIDILPRRRIDLLLCGHTHGGQIRFPFFGAVVVPSMHEAEYASGFHRLGPVLVYVSRGIGSIPPLRILCRPEVATFTLRRGHRTE
jgi:predicted MPP superfamily phosphohydrolase